MTILSNVFWLIFIPFISTIVGNVFVIGYNSNVMSKFENDKDKKEELRLLGTFKFLPVLIMTITFYLILSFNLQS